MTKFWSIGMLTLTLAACGGGGGGGQASTSPPPTVPAHHTDFGFWYTESGQLDATAKNVNIVFCQDDSPDIAYGEMLLIQCAQEAQAHGIKKWIASVWPLLFSPTLTYLGSGAIASFCGQLQSLGIMPVAFYIMDEPDVNGGPQAATLIQEASTDVRKACPGPKIAAIYASTTPGMQYLDWVGRDNKTDPGQLDSLPLLGAGQEYLLVPYGSSKWREDPTPYVTFASTHAVAAILAFAWATFNQYVGISVDGEAPVYLQAGCTATGLC